jgi:uroporphyrinogen-III synthase
MSTTGRGVMDEPPGGAAQVPDAATAAVVITRPRQQAEPLARAVAALGRTPVVLPLLDIAPLPDQAPLKAVLDGLAGYALVAFVSPNAVDAAMAHVARWPDGVAIAVVGEGSRAALARHGIDDGNATIHCPLDPARADSEHLLQALDLARLRGRRVLVVRGESGRELLPDALRAAGAAVETVAAYRRAVPMLTPALAAALHALLAGRHDWIVTSSEALRGLASLAAQLDTGANVNAATATSVAKLQRQHLIVPHARIAETARALGFAEITLTGSGDERMLAALQS